MGEILFLSELTWFRFWFNVNFKVLILSTNVDGKAFRRVKLFIATAHKKNSLGVFQSLLGFNWHYFTKSFPPKNAYQMHVVLPPFFSSVSLIHILW